MNSQQTVTVPSHSWFGDIERTLSFPAGWDVHVCACEDAPALSSAQIAAAFDSPIGTPRIRDAAKGRGSAAIMSSMTWAGRRRPRICCPMYLRNWPRLAFPKPKR